MRNKSYRIDTGNSNTGQVGFVAYVKAPNKKAAKAKLAEQLGREGHKLRLGESDSEVLVYFNVQNVPLKDIQLED